MADAAPKRGIYVLADGMGGHPAGNVASKTAVGALLPASFADQRRLVTPISGLAIALVISVESLYHDAGLPWIITAVIGGSLLTELLVSRKGDEAAAAAARSGVTRVPIDELEAAPIDELDDLGSDGVEDNGPIYRDDAIGGPK